MSQTRQERVAPRPEGAAAWLFAAHRVGLGIASRVAPGVARRWATHLFCTPPRHPHPPVEQDWIARGRPFEVTARRRRVAGWRWGEESDSRETRGRRVLLVHGWGGRGTQLHAFIQPLLDAGYEVVAFDAPAHGFSESRYASMLHFAQAIQAVAEAVGGVNGIIAHSLGGAATNLALSRGWLKTDRVVTVAAPTDFDAYSRYFARQLNVTDRVRDAMQLHLETRLGVPWRDLEGGRLAATQSTPALIVHDRGDREVPFSAAERIASHWPGAVLLPTEKLGHRRILRDPAVVARAVEFMGVIKTRRRATDFAPDSHG